MIWIRTSTRKARPRSSSSRSAMWIVWPPSASFSTRTRIRTRGSGGYRRSLVHATNQNDVFLLAWQLGANINSPRTSRSRLRPRSIIIPVSVRIHPARTFPTMPSSLPARGFPDHLWGKARPTFMVGTPTIPALTIPPSLLPSPAPTSTSTKMASTTFWCLSCPARSTSSSADTTPACLGLCRKFRWRRARARRVQLRA